MKTKAKTVRVRQGTAEWAEFRRSHVGASDAPVIVGLSPYASPYALWAEKTGRVERAATPVMRVGKAFEPVILDLYSEERGVRLRRGRVLEHREETWLSASLDAETPDRLVEAKRTSSSRWDDGVPDDVVVQVTHAMAVSGHRLADVAVVGPWGFRIFPVPFDQALWDRVFRTEREFWERVRRGVPPDVDGSESTRQAIVAASPVESEPLVVDDPVVTALVSELLPLKDEAAEIERQMSVIENAIRERLAGAEGASGPGYSVSYRKTKDSEVIDWTAYARALENLLEGVDLTQLRSPYVTIKPGIRRLVVRRAK